MKELTKAQYDALNADEWIITNLRYTRSGFKRQTTTRQNDIVFDIYDELSGTKNYRNYGCPNCLFKAWSAVAKAYYAYTPTVEEIVEEVAQSAPSDDITTDEVTEPKKPAKKSTAKKKSAKKKSSKSAEQQRLRSKTK